MPHGRPHLRRLLIATAVIATAASHLLAGPPMASIHSPLAEVESIQSAIKAVVDRTAPSVFAVTSFNDVPTDPRLWAGTLHGNAFGAFTERQGRNCGSAFAIDDDGTLLTNEHVVNGAASIWVTDDAGRSWPAVVIGTDPRSDLAVIRIPRSTIPLAPADGVATQRGDLVVTLGNPDGLAAQGGTSASLGIVSAVNRSLPTLSARERRSYANLIQMTTPITSGSSGGPLMDLDGHAVGLVTAVAPKDGARAAVGFAIDLTSEATRDAIAQLVAGAEVTHGYLGVTIADARLAIDAADSQVAGARIDAIERDAPADGVLRAGDVVLSFADQPVESGDMLSRLSATSPVDQDVAIRIDRAGEQLDLTIRPRRRLQPNEPVTTRTQTLAWAGARFRNASNGVEVIASDAEPLHVGNIIRAVNGEPVGDVTALLRVLHANAGKPLSIQLAD